MLHERGALLGETAEHEALVGLDACHPSHREVEFAPAVSLEERKADEFAGVPVRPPVQRTPERRRVALGVIADLIPAMRAPVQEKVNAAISIAGHDDVLQPEPLAHVVTRLADFAFVADEYPCAVPDFLKFFGEDGRIGVERAVHLVVLDQGRDAACAKAVGCFQPRHFRGHSRTPFPAPKTAGRFSRNAVTPSTKSSLPKRAA